MISRRFFATLAVAGSAFLAVGPVAALAADAVTITHDQGTTEVPAAPKRVVVFDMPVLDTLNVLEVAVSGVPGGVKPEHLEHYNADAYAKVGTLFEPDYEAVNALAPDLIIVGGRSAPKYKDLSRIAPTIDLSISPESFLDDALGNARTLGRIFGKEEAVEQRITALTDSMAALRATAAEAGKGMLILTTGGRMSAFGPGSRFGLLHDGFGVKPANPNLDIGLHGQAISFEFILETNPDWLFVLDRDAAIGREGQPARQFLDNEIVRQTSAWRKGQVVYLNGGNWYLSGGGLRALQAEVDAVQAALSAKQGS